MSDAHHEKILLDQHSNILRPASAPQPPDLRRRTAIANTATNLTIWLPATLPFLSSVTHGAARASPTRLLLLCPSSRSRSNTMTSLRKSPSLNCPSGTLGTHPFRPVQFTNNRAARLVCLAPCAGQIGHQSRVKLAHGSPQSGAPGSQTHQPHCLVERSRRCQLAQSVMKVPWQASGGSR